MDLVSFTDEGLLSYAQERGDLTDLETELADRLRRALAEIDMLSGELLADREVR